MLCSMVHMVVESRNELNNLLPERIDHSMKPMLRSLENQGISLELRVLGQVVHSGKNLKLSEHYKHQIVLCF